VPKPQNKLQEKWFEILFPHHKNMWKKAYKKVRTKVSSINANYGIKAEDLIAEAYGTECLYCDRKLVVSNISIDHIIPQSRGGENSIENTHVICNRCNRRKGVLDHLEYISILVFLSTKSELFRNYVLRKLASKDWGEKK